MYTERMPETEHEKQAAMLLERTFRDTRSLYYVVPVPSSAFIYDWADPATNRVGQCWVDDYGKWKQAPLGENPVVFATIKVHGRKKRH